MTTADQEALALRASTSRLWARLTILFSPLAAVVAFPLPVFFHIEEGIYLGLMISLIVAAGAIITVRVGGIWIISFAANVIFWALGTWYFFQVASALAKID